jgi:hypothetical protein
MTISRDKAELLADQAAARAERRVRDNFARLGQSPDQTFIARARMLAAQAAISGLGWTITTQGLMPS